MCAFKFYIIFVKAKYKMAAICFKKNICNFVHFTWLCIEIIDIKQN